MLVAWLSVIRNETDNRKIHDNGPGQVIVELSVHRKASSYAQGIQVIPQTIPLGWLGGVPIICRITTAREAYRQHVIFIEARRAAPQGLHNARDLKKMFSSLDYHL